MLPINVKKDFAAEYELTPIKSHKTKIVPKLQLSKTKCLVYSHSNVSSIRAEGQPHTNCPDLAI